MDEFYSYFLKQTGWLYLKIFENKLFFIDYWTLPHLWSGLVIFTILTALGTKHKAFWFIFLLTSYELLEVFLEIFALNIFNPETIKDKLTDIIIGVIGGVAGYNILRWVSQKTKYPWLRRTTPILFSSVTLSFLWVGNYQYHYNIAWLNIPGLNLWAFGIWLAGGFIVLYSYLLMKKTISILSLQVIFSWLIYFCLLILIEFFGYHLLHIREASPHEKNPLIFGLIHGSRSLHVYYIIFPFIIILFYETTIKIVDKARRKFSAASKTIESA